MHNQPWTIFAARSSNPKKQLVKKQYSSTKNEIVHQSYYSIKKKRNQRKNNIFVQSVEYVCQKNLHFLLVQRKPKQSNETTWNNQRDPGSEPLMKSSGWKSPKALVVYCFFGGCLFRKALPPVFLGLGLLLKCWWFLDDIFLFDFCHLRFVHWGNGFCLLLKGKGYERFGWNCNRFLFSPDGFSEDIYIILWFTSKHQHWEKALQKLFKSCCNKHCSIMGILATPPQSYPPQK